MMKYSIAYLICLSILFFSCSWGTHEEKVRPIKIKVIDSKTNLPLSNMRIYRVVEVFENVNTMLFGLLPRPEPKIKDRVVVKNSDFTNSEGVVVFGEKTIVMGKKEQLYKERVFINIEYDQSKTKYPIPDDEEAKYKDEIDKLNDCFFSPISCDEILSNINKKYKGAYVLSPFYEFPAGDYKWAEAIHFSWIRVSKGILKDQEEIVIKLKHYDGKPIEYDHAESDRKVAEFKKAFKEYREEKRRKE